MGALDELLSAFRQNPSAELAIALSEQLATNVREDWIREVGGLAQTWHLGDPGVMLAVGRMYLAAGLLREAESALSTASGTDPSATPLRWLGEVLLRRGDAQRAEQVLKRAVAQGAKDRDALSLRSRAAGYVSLQKRSGPQGVAAEVARLMPLQSAPAGSPAQQRSSNSRSAPQASVREAPLPSFDASDALEFSEVHEVSAQKKAPKARASGDVTSRMTPSIRATAAPRTRSNQAAPLATQGGMQAARVGRSSEPSFEDITELMSSASEFEEAEFTEVTDRISDDDTANLEDFEYSAEPAQELGTRQAEAHSEEFEEELPTRVHQAAPKEWIQAKVPANLNAPVSAQAPSAPAAQAALSAKPPNPSSREPTSAARAIRSTAAPAARLPSPPTALPSQPPALRGAASSRSVSARSVSPQPGVSARSVSPNAPSAQPAAAAFDARSAAQLGSPWDGSASGGPAPSVRSSIPRAVSVPTATFEVPSAMSDVRRDVLARSDDPRFPAPSILLQHLARVGVFEPSSGVAPAWEAAPKQKSRGVVPLVAAMLVVLAAGGGAYQYSQVRKAEQLAQAQALNDEVSQLLHSPRARDVRATDAKLSRAFDLDSRSQLSARLWLANRVLSVLLTGEEARGIDSAVHRGREVGLPEPSLAAARMASFFIEGDLAGAAALLPKWDVAAAKEPLYQLVAGAVLERAGDIRALERYSAARTLDPKLAFADLLYIQACLLEGEREPALRALAELKSKLPEGDVSLRVLEALAFATLASSEGGTAPELPERGELELIPAPLASVPGYVSAVLALRRGDKDAALAAVEGALLRVNGPAMAARLGQLAVELGNENLARKSALKALSFSGTYVRARTLAARVALLGGRLDEAQKAVEELEPTAKDVAVVHAAVAYESLDPASLASSLSTLGELAKEPEFAALALGADLQKGVRYPAPSSLESLASPEVAWGELVALDAALDTGNLDFADRLFFNRDPATLGSVHLLRLARLRRYQKRTDEALAATARALTAKPAPALVTERVLSLIDKEQVQPARELLLKHASSLGSQAGWLGVLVDWAAKQPAQAVTRLSQLEPPSDEAPIHLRVLAGRALAEAADKRARPFVGVLFRRASKHPDAMIAALALRGR